jgi:hypothetical protein
MPPHILFLTGSPVSSSLIWESSDLLDDFTAPFARFVGLDPSRGVPVHFSDSEPRHASWRALDADRKHLPTGYSPRHTWMEEYQGDADFFNMSKPSFGSFNSNFDTLQLPDDQGTSSEPAEDVLSQFYEHSFALHTAAASSQIARSQSNEVLTYHGSDTGISFTSGETSFISKTDSFSASSPLKEPPIRSEIPIQGGTVDLKDVPNAKFLDSIQPQTMTVNLIVGIISVAPPRAIKTRRGAEVELIELLVGDETKSGFGVNFWLPAHSNDVNSEKNEDSVRNRLASLRIQDIVLLQNVALSSFRRMVYGQSLKKDLTKLHLLYRNRVNRADIGGHYTIGDLDVERDLHSQLKKTVRVRDWILRFVARGPFDRNGEADQHAMMDSLPLDTQ